MNVAEVVLDKEGRYYGLSFECAGCEFGHHMVPTDWTPEGRERVERSPGTPTWQFNGDLKRPTLSPSILCRASIGKEYRNVVCHFFVAHGRMQFCSDSTHALAGQTVDMTPVDP